MIQKVAYRECTSCFQVSPYPRLTQTYEPTPYPRPPIIVTKSFLWDFSFSFLFHRYVLQEDPNIQICRTAQDHRADFARFGKDEGGTRWRAGYAQGVWQLELGGRWSMEVCASVTGTRRLGTEEVAGWRGPLQALTIQAYRQCGVFEMKPRPGSLAVHRIDIGLCLSARRCVNQFDMNPILLFVQLLANSMLLDRIVEANQINISER